MRSGRGEPVHTVLRLSGGDLSSAGGSHDLLLSHVGLMNETVASVVKRVGT